MYFQIYILAAPPGKLVTAMFRIHLHMLTGAPIAILFPVINTRLVSIMSVHSTVTRWKTSGSLDTVTIYRYDHVCVYLHCISNEAVDY